MEHSNRRPPPRTYVQGSPINPFKGGRSNASTFSTRENTFGASRGQEDPFARRGSAFGAQSARRSTLHDNAPNYVKNRVSDVSMRSATPARPSQTFTRSNIY